MSDGEAPPFHLLLASEEVAPTERALKLLIADEAHEPPLRALARESLQAVEGATAELGRLSVELTPTQMKMTHTALRLRFADLTRDQAEELELIRTVLGKLPDEHVMRAIEVP